jgi:hypothetical protein
MRTDKISPVKTYILNFFKWGLLGILMGAWGGLLGAAFHHALHFVTHLRSEHTWLIFLLPVGGLLSVGIYTLFQQRSNRGTNEVIDAVLKGENPRYTYGNGDNCTAEGYEFCTEEWYYCCGAMGSNRIEINGVCFSGMHKLEECTG